MLAKFPANTFLGFVTIGILTVAVNLFTFQFTLYFGASIYIATFIGNLISILVNYAGLAGVFKSKTRIRSIVKYSATWISYYFLTIWFVIFFLKFELSPIVARTVTLGILTPLNYLIQKYLVFKN